MDQREIEVSEQEDEGDVHQPVVQHDRAREAEARVALAEPEERPGHGEEERKCAQDGEPEQQAVRPHARSDPERLIEDGARQAEQREHGPAPLARQVEEPGVEEEDVAEEADRPIRAGREQERRQEAADQTERRDHLRRMPPGEEAAAGGHGDHQHERDRCGHEAVTDARGPERGVEDDHAGAGERVGGARVLPAEPPLRAGNAGDADHGAEHDAQPGRDEPVLDRILEEEEPGQRERDAAETRRRADAEELLPVDRDARRGDGRRRGGPRRGRGRRGRCRGPRGERRDGRRCDRLRRRRLPHGRRLRLLRALRRGLSRLEQGAQLPHLALESGDALGQRAARGGAGESDHRQDERCDADQPEHAAGQLTATARPVSSRACRGARAPRTRPARRPRRPVP